MESSLAAAVSEVAEGERDRLAFLDDEVTEFPVVDNRIVGLPYRYSFNVLFEPGQWLMSGLKRYDLKTGASTVLPSALVNASDCVIFSRRFSAANSCSRCLITATPLILVSPPSFAPKTVQELVAWAKANPGKSNYATTAPGFTLPAELFKLKMGIPAIGITYRSAAEGAVGLMTGAASMAFFTPPGIVNLVKEGKLRALAVTTATRSADLPDVPTLKELGFPNLAPVYFAFVAPTGTPAPVIRRLHEEIAHIGNDPDFPVHAEEHARAVEERAAVVDDQYGDGVPGIHVCLGMAAAQLCRTRALSGSVRAGTIGVFRVRPRGIP